MRKVDSTKELQLMALNILEKVSIFCRENNIQFFLAYGTLIGAIRHHGYIPWDDDIDIWMPREEFDRFIKIFPAWAKNNELYLTAPSITNHYNKVHAQVCMEKTKKIEKGVNDYKSGMFIDIFPFEGSPNNRLIRELHMTRLQLYKILSSITTIDESFFNGYKKVFLIIRFLFLKIDPQKFCIKYEKIARRYKVGDSDNVIFSLAYKHGRGGCIKANLFSKAVNMPFEDKKFPVPIGYDEILRFIYNDYMKMPPEDKRKGYHTCDIYIDD